MKPTTILAIIALLALLVLAPAHAQVPSILNYQGRVTVGGTNITTNAALFKFALVNGDGTAVYWKNDGTTTTSEPSSAVTVAVAQGLYSTLLGDTTLNNMASIPSSAFTNENVNLRVWFSAGGTNPFVQVAPDQRLGASGYALRAAVADNIASTNIDGNFAVTGTLTVGQLVGGTSSTASGQFATVSGGLSNAASGDYTMIGGGRNNTASNDYATIGGGAGNTASVSYATIGGGGANTSSGVGATIGGGYQNNNSGFIATIGGGQENTSSGNFATIGGGQQNTNSGDLATIGGGAFNGIASNAPHSVIAGGLSNSIDTNASFAFIPGGQGALASLYGQAAHAAGSFVTRGDAQATEYILRGETVGAVTNVIFLDGVSKRLTIKPKQTLVFGITVAARNTANFNAGYQIQAVAERTGSSIYVNGSTASPVDVTPIFEDPSASAWKVQLKPNSATSSVDVEVIGAAGNTIRWVAVIRATEIYIPQ